ncbi:hypothetical protein IQ274_32830 [Nostoc sp. LEGE 12447]|uniref:hypothetical protein n=1 Tax=Nostoc sp. LEGE 12447 TaxID=1828640 RepID=UPI0018847548|nr:hypothetical protein [Nostoc sp. LEGE 12447]MBE9002842.1 hypothetical protein [Nostoc sp. LEGE 12447]
MTSGMVKTAGMQQWVIRSQVQPLSSLQKRRGMDAVHRLDDGGFMQGKKKEMALWASDVFAFILVWHQSLCGSLSHSD